jgi:hypothetical protein
MVESPTGRASAVKVGPASGGVGDELMGLMRCAWTTAEKKISVEKKCRS